MVYLENIYKNLGHQVKQIDDSEAQKKENVEVIPVTGNIYLNDFRMLIVYV